VSVLSHFLLSDAKMELHQLTANNRVATGLVLGSMALWWQFLGRSKSSSSIPHVPHRTPFIGSGIDFLGSMLVHSA
jgi:hypothetical protein